MYLNKIDKLKKHWLEESIDNPPTYSDMKELFDCIDEFKAEYDYWASSAKDWEKLAIKKTMQLKEYEQLEAEGQLIKLLNPNIKIDDMTANQAINIILEHNNHHFQKEYPRAQLITQALNMAVKALTKEALEKEEDKT